MSSFTMPLRSKYLGHLEQDQDGQSMVSLYDLNFLPSHVKWAKCRNLSFYVKSCVRSICSCHNLNILLLTHNDNAFFFV